MIKVLATFIRLFGQPKAAPSAKEFNANVLPVKPGDVLMFKTNRDYATKDELAHVAKMAERVCELFPFPVQSFAVDKTIDVSVLSASESSSGKIPMHEMPVDDGRLSYKSKSTDSSDCLFKQATPDGGIIRLAKWPEGYVLWHHGSIVWRSWVKTPPPLPRKI